MANEKDYPNSGILFRNDRKVSPKHADYTGDLDSICPACQTRTQWFLNSWLKVGRTGTKFLTLSVKAKDGYARQPAAASDDDSF